MASLTAAAGSFFMPKYTAQNARTSLPPPPRFEDVFAAPAVAAAPFTGVEYIGPETFFDLDVDAPELYNAIEALHCNSSLAACLLPRRDRAPIITAAPKKGARSHRGKRADAADLTIPAGPAGILTSIFPGSAPGFLRSLTDGCAVQHGFVAPDDQDGSGALPLKRKRSAGAAGGVVVGSSEGADALAPANPKRPPRPRPAPFGTGSTSSHRSEAAMALAAAQDASATFSLDGHGRQPSIEDACRATSVGGDLGGAPQGTAVYCNYTELYSKLQRASNSVFSSAAGRQDRYKMFLRFPCVLWSDPASCVGEFVILSREFPAFNVNCPTHGPLKVVKWKKSGSPQYRDMAGSAGAEQLMSQFAVARSLSDNSKAFSARISCVVRGGEAQGVHIVQVRPAEASSGQGTGGGKASLKRGAGTGIDAPYGGGALMDPFHVRGFLSGGGARSAQPLAAAATAGHASGGLHFSLLTSSQAEPAAEGDDGESVG